MIVALLDANADITVKNLGGFTPLHSAAAHGNVESVRILLNAGADPLP